MVTTGFIFSVHGPHPVMQGFRQDGLRFTGTRRFSLVGAEEVEVVVVDVLACLRLTGSQPEHPGCVHGITQLINGRFSTTVGACTGMLEHSRQPIIHGMQMSEHSLFEIIFAVDEDAPLIPDFSNIEKNPFVLRFLGVDAATGLMAKAGTVHGMQFITKPGHGSQVTFV